MKTEKLKTLKDLRGTIGKPFGVLGDGKIKFGFREDDLKAEAVKWIKEDFELVRNPESHRMLERWKSRFNLREEDLK